ncbi:MAG: hypothetical protein EBZ96_04120 [Synechococcaceae bacterium WB9_3_282]|nr:hypothetical protein [Synechococcaceae bacterium WB9_3_282]
MLIVANIKKALIFSVCVQIHSKSLGLLTNILLLRLLACKRYWWIYSFWQFSQIHLKNCSNWLRPAFASALLGKSRWKIAGNLL